ncbi:hypothetical protein [Shinella granuli]|uniref:DUF2946 family protein n=1 Tax=Shinella granuli TaxID=323621 RepID=A0A4R2CS20_SHIGR|nr:hypothetical protein [Shinella granuli]TCN43515.1 hypothetical protein EV665_110113 [Shinella granuli]
MNKRLQQSRIGMVAFAVAILMALQVLLSPFAVAASAATSPVDAFGNPLCITHIEEQEPASAPGKERSLAPDCCVLACGSAAAFVPTHHAVPILFNPLAQPSQRILDGYGDTVPSVYDALPGHPRGPPTSA